MSAIGPGPFERFRVGTFGPSRVHTRRPGVALRCALSLLLAICLVGLGATASVAQEPGPERRALLDVRAADGTVLDPADLMSAEDLEKLLAGDLLKAATIDASVLPFDLPPGATVTIFFEVTVDNPPASPGNATIENTAMATGTNFTTVDSVDPAGDIDADDPTDTNLTVQADLAITKDDGVTSATPGGQVVYTIVATNNGPTTVTDAAVADMFPGTLTCSWTSVAMGGATGNSNSSGNLSEVLSMPSGSSVTYTVTCDIAPDARGTLMNTATISSMAITDPIPGNNSASDNDTVLVPVVDLGITKTDSADPVNAAAAYSYTIQVSNAGTSSALGVQVIDTLPAGVTYVGFSGTDWSCSPAGSIITCDLGVAIDPMASAPDLTINVTAPDEGGVVINNATATSDEDMVGVATMEDTTITAVTNLAITKADSADPVDAASAFMYTIGVTNNGPSTATSVQVVDTLPAGLTFDGKNAASTDWSCVEAPAGTVTCNLAGSLASGASAQNLVFDVTAPSTGGVIVNNATVTSSENMGGVATMEDTTITAVADLAVTKDDGVTDVPVGGSLTYTITVENLGPSDDPSVSFDDTFPAELINCSWTSVASGGATGNSSSSGAAIMDTLDMPVGSSVTYTVDCDVDPLTMSPDVTNTATATASVSDPNAGNDSDSDTDTILYDTDPPAVVRINSSPDTGDGEVTDCEQVAVRLNDLLVVFDEAMATMPDAGAADDASNFLLIEAGADGDYQTTACGVPAGDDQAVTPAMVTYDADTPAPPESTSTLDFGSLADGLYRLIACSSLTDEAGNALDGGAFVRDFRIEAGNLFTNGHFDCNDDGWQTSPAAVSWDGTVDQDGSTVSGSEQVDSGGVAMATITQCVDVAGASNPFELTASLSLSAGGGVQVGVARFCDFFSAAACGGTLLGGVSGSGVILEDTGGAFIGGTAMLNAPGGTVSAACGIEVLSPDAETFQLWVDGAHLTGSGLIFADGFESGDTSAWSVTVP